MNPSISNFAEYARLALETVYTYGKQSRLPDSDVLISLGGRAVADTCFPLDQATDTNANTRHNRDWLDNFNWQGV